MNSNILLIVLISSISLVMLTFDNIKPIISLLIWITNILALIIFLFSFNSKFLSLIILIIYAGLFIPLNLVTFYSSDIFSNKSTIDAYTDRKNRVYCMYLFILLTLILVFLYLDININKFTNIDYYNSDIKVLIPNTQSISSVIYNNTFSLYTLNLDMCIYTIYIYMLFNHSIFYIAVILFLVILFVVQLLKNY